MSGVLFEKTALINNRLLDRLISSDQNHRKQEQSLYVAVFVFFTLPYKF